MIRNLCLSLLVLAAACGDLEQTPSRAGQPDQREATTSALSWGGGELAGYWERSVECDGAHFDRYRITDPVHSGMDGTLWQMVITDANAVGYLDGKVEEQKRSPLGLSTIDASNVPHGWGEIVIYMDMFWGSNAREGAWQEQFKQWAALGRNNDSDITIQRYTWYPEVAPGTYKKASDVKVTYNRNGWSDYCVNYEEATGLCRGYAVGGSEPKPGWGPFEISNWVFRDCRNL